MPPRAVRRPACSPLSASTASSEFSFAAPGLNVFVGATTTARLTCVSMPSSDS